MNKQLPQIKEQRKWIIVGGSYPGALSAWFHYKYPHLSVMSWSSSGVINNIADYTQFDGHVYKITHGIDD